MDLRQIVIRILQGRKHKVTHKPVNEPVLPGPNPINVYHRTGEVIA